jgi:hypothetical protein
MMGFEPIPRFSRERILNPTGDEASVDLRFFWKLTERSEEEAFGRCVSIIFGTHISGL